MVKVSVIITSYNNSHNLARCSDSLIGQDYDRKNVELESIVVDSGSTDNSVEILKRYEDKLILVINPRNSPRLSPASARNIGAAKARGDILIFSDSDCVPPTDWVKNMVDDLKA